MGGYLNFLRMENITALKPYEVFVFGSDIAGRHGKEVVKLSLGWGAQYWKGSGMSGNTYAIPTKTSAVIYGEKSKDTLENLDLHYIKAYVGLFIDVAMTEYKEWTFLVTEIGCGLDGYSPKDIAPLFKDAVNVPNIHLPQSFWDILNEY